MFITFILFISWFMVIVQSQQQQQQVTCPLVVPLNTLQCEEYLLLCMSGNDDVDMSIPADADCNCTTQNYCLGECLCDVEGKCQPLFYICNNETSTTEYEYEQQNNQTLN